MSLQTATAAQRQTLRDSLAKLAQATQPFAQDGKTPTDAEVANVNTLATQAYAALIAVGIS